MISSARYKTQATVSIIYFILFFFFLGLFTIHKSRQVSIKDSTTIVGNSQNVLTVSQPDKLTSPSTK